jgi:hypothetical protein
VAVEVNITALCPLNFGGLTLRFVKKKKIILAQVVLENVA